MKNRKYSTRKNGVITKEYKTYKAIKARCYSPSQTKGNYKKDNIQVCERWLSSFDNFIDDMGYAPSDKHSIERIDNSKNYEPDNCKWIIVNEQPKNRSSVKYFTYNCKTLILKDWARELNINYTTLYNRIYRQKMSFEEAINYSNLIEIDGVYKTVKDWCSYYNINYNTIINFKFKNKELDYQNIIMNRIKSN